MKKLFILICPLILLAGCVKNKEDYNIDQKNAVAVPASTLFTGAMLNLSNALTTPSVNSNVFRLYVQHWTTTTYLDEPRYNLTARTIPLGLWQSIYRDVLSDLHESKRIINADALLSAAQKSNELAQIEINPTAASAAVKEAAANVFASNADNASFPYASSTPINNPIADNLNPILTSRKDFLAANTLINRMNTLNDPRRQYYFTTVNNEYKGGLYGFTNVYTDYSSINPNIYALNFPGLLLDYSEVEFLLAEAVERGFVTGTAATYYNNGITASIAYWGGSTAAATTYLANTAVAYATAAGNYKQKIGTQKWIALYNRGFDAWTEWRRLDYPVLLPPTGGNAPAGLAIPTRLIYPPTEASLNSNYKAAAAAIGGDLATTKLFWDKF
ncbi:MAG: SusD/RagB family nutrient-binding outer membrane lipoprotein [Sphingobacteriaceae bacterium]|nr:MAG: SusD/RagB family nutrient-binding outer membrane lipoprotein [Sphingobacteriaceae bacterium]